MKVIAITLITPLSIVLLLFLCGLLSSRPKSRIKFYFYSLIILLISCTPITSLIISYPLITLVKTMDQNQDNIKAVIVLSGGIEEDISGGWRPSNDSLNRTLLGKSYSDKLSVPLLISGGITGSNFSSEAIVIRDYLKLNNSMIEQNSMNTYESAKNLESFCRRENGPLLLISGDYHRLRSYLSFKSHNCHVLLPEKKVKLSLSLLYPSSDGIKLLEKVTYEFMGLFYYLITNKIKPLVLFNI